MKRRRSNKRPHCFEEANANKWQNEGDGSHLNEEKSSSGWNFVFQYSFRLLRVMVKHTKNRLEGKRVRSDHILSMGHSSVVRSEYFDGDQSIFSIWKHRSFGYLWSNGKDGAFLIHFKDRRAKHNIDCRDLPSLNSLFLLTIEKSSMSFVSIGPSGRQKKFFLEHFSSDEEERCFSLAISICSTTICPYWIDQICSDDPPLRRTLPEANPFVREVRGKVPSNVFIPITALIRWGSTDRSEAEHLRCLLTRKSLQIISFPSLYESFRPEIERRSGKENLSASRWSWLLAKRHPCEWKVRWPCRWLKNIFVRFHLALCPISLIREDCPNVSYEEESLSFLSALLRFLFVRHTKTKLHLTIVFADERWSEKDLFWSWLSQWREEKDLN